MINALISAALLFVLLALACVTMFVGILGVLWIYFWILDWIYGFKD